MREKNAADTFIDHVISLIRRVRGKVGERKFDKAVTVSLAFALAVLIIFWIFSHSVMIEVLLIMLGGGAGYAALRVIDNLLAEGSSIPRTSGEGSDDDLSGVRSSQ